MISGGRNKCLGNVVNAMHMDFVAGDRINLKRIGSDHGSTKKHPLYCWRIVLPDQDIEVGEIRLRIGHSVDSYYLGNIEFEIKKEYRGNHYALAASFMMLEIARRLGMGYLIITCDDENEASRKTIEKLNASLIEVSSPSKEFTYYYDGIGKYRIYRIDL